MTRFSRTAALSDHLADIDRIAADLRRQRHDLDTLWRCSDASSGETSRLLEKIEALRRRMEALPAHDHKREPKD
jgi:hypothetical protein